MTTSCGLSGLWRASKVSSDGTSSFCEAWQVPKQVGRKLWLSAGMEVPAGPGLDTTPDRADRVLQPRRVLFSTSSSCAAGACVQWFKSTHSELLSCPPTNQRAGPGCRQFLHSVSLWGLSFQDCWLCFLVLFCIHSFFISFSLSLAVVDMHCCIKIVPQTEQLKPPHTSYLAASVSWEHRRGFVGFCHTQGCPAGLGSHSEAGLGKSLIPGSLTCWQNSFPPSWRTEGLGFELFHSIACIWVLEAACISSRGRPPPSTCMPYHCLQKSLQQDS